MAENKENYIKKADEMISNDETGYFAAKTPEKLVETLESKTENWYSNLESNGWMDKLRTAYAMYYGAENSSIGNAHQIQWGGDDGEIAEIKINHYRSIAKSMLNMVTSVRPAMECQAVNTDAKSQVQTKLGNGLLDYYMRAADKKLEQRLKEACELAITMGSGFVKMSWNANAGKRINIEEIQKAKRYRELGQDIEVPQPEYEGDVEFSNHSPLDIITDITKEDIQLDWLIVRDTTNKYDLIRTFPHLAKEIDRIESKTEVASNFGVYNPAINKEETDDVFIYEFYHESTASVPEGRYTLYCDSETILYDGPLPYRRIPVYGIKPARVLGTPLGHTDMFELMPLQTGIDGLATAILTNNMAFGVQQVLVPKQANLSIDQIGNGLSVMEYNTSAQGGGKPEALQLTQSSPEAYNFLNTLIQYMETLSGISSVVRGNPEASLRSGAAIAMIQSNAIQYQSTLQAEYVHLIEDVGLGLLNMLIDFADSPRIADIVGANGKNWVKQFKGEDLREINRVVVNSANPLTKSIAGRTQMADNLLQYGEITAAQYMNVINTGNLDTATDGKINTQMTIQNENEALLEGSKISVLAYEQHYDHINGHLNLVSDPAMKQDVGLVKIVTDHINEHINQLMTVNPQTLMAMGMQPIQPAQPQGGPPGAPPQGAPQGAPGAAPAQEPNPSALPPEEQAVQQTGAQPQEGPQMPAGFEGAPISPEQNLARISGQE